MSAPSRHFCAKPARSKRRGRKNSTRPSELSAECGVPNAECEMGKWELTLPDSQLATRAIKCECRMRNWQSGSLLCRMAGQQAMQDDCRADQRQRDERQANP